MEQAPLDKTNAEPVTHYREMEERDYLRMMELGATFFVESEFPEFSTFNEETLLTAFEHAMDNPFLHALVFEDQGEVQGFLGYQVDATYTNEPLGLMWLFYVHPDYRQSPVGRGLLSYAEEHAANQGCVAFYAGAMSGIGRVKKTIENMYTKAGYEPLYWGRKILKRRDEDV